MDFGKLPGLGMLGPMRIVGLAILSLLIYLTLFAINFASSKRELVELGRLTEARESVSSMRASLKQFLLDDTMLGNRRALPPETVEQLKKSTQDSSAQLSRSLREVEAFIARESQDIPAIEMRLERLRDLSGRRAALLDSIYGADGLLPRFVTARNASDAAFTAISEEVPLPTKNYLASKSAQNEFLGGRIAQSAVTAQLNLRLYKQEVSQFPGLQASQRRVLSTAADLYLAAFVGVADAFTAADVVQREIQSISDEMLAIIDRVTVAVGDHAAAETERIENRGRLVDALAAVMAILTALVFTSVSLSAFRLAAERDRHLRRSNARFRDLAHSSSDIFVEVDAQGHITLIEGAREEYVEDSVTDIEHKPFVEAMNMLGMSSDHKHVLLAAFHERRPVRDLEYRAVRPKTSQEVWYSLSGMPVFDENKVFAGFRCAIRDISARVSQDRRLLAISTAVENASDGVIVFNDTDGPIAYANQAVNRMFAVPEHIDLTGRYLVEFLPRESHQAAAAVRADGKAALKEGREWQLESQVARADGKFVSVLFRGTALPDKRVVVMMTDVTQHIRMSEQIKRSQAERERLLANLPGAAYQVEWTGEHYVPGFFSRRIEEISGYPDQQLVDTAPNGTSLLPALDAQTRVRELQAARANDVRYDIIWRMRTKAGDIRWILEQGQHFALPDGRVVAEGHLTDISERIRQENEERALRQRLSEAQRFEAIGSLAGGVAHDFNNIIGAARGFADLLVTDLPDGEPKRYAERIVATCKRAALLVREIMAFSRVRDEEHEVVGISGLIAEAQDILVGRPDRRIELEVDDRVEGICVRGNHSQLSQVISNIVINAADATPETVSRIRLTTLHMPEGRFRFSDAEWVSPSVRTQSGRAAHVLTQGHVRLSGEYVRLTIEDKGTGMSEKVLNKIFEPFFTTKEKNRGTGLGLAVVAAIVDAHDGAIRVESVPGAGTTFKIYLPVVQAGISPQAAPSPAKAVRAAGAVRGKERILIVDDEVDIADALAIALDRMGYEAAPVYDPKEALEIFNENPGAWDVVISDQSMPKMRGIQLMRKIRARKPEIRTILCTGHSEALTPERVAEEGIDGFFHKPVAAETLARTIRGLFQAGTTAGSGL